jgi:hypothetical protein
MSDLRSDVLDHAQREHHIKIAFGKRQCGAVTMQEMLPVAAKARPEGRQARQVDTVRFESLLVQKRDLHAEAGSHFENARGLLADQPGFEKLLIETALAVSLVCGILIAR